MISEKQLTELLDYQNRRVEFHKEKGRLDVRDLEILKFLKSQLLSRKEKKTKVLNIPFDKFWFLYDKKVDRELTRERWAGLTDTERRLAIIHVPYFKSQYPDKTFRCSPARYLLRKKWTDEFDLKDTQDQSKQEWLKGNE